MNRSRYVPTLLAAGTLVLAGCASGGGAGGGSGGGSGGRGEDALRENEYTRTAELRLTQAELGGALQHFSDALEAAMSSIAEDPTNAIGYYQAARAQIGLRDYAAADTLFDKALEFFPGYLDDIQIARESAWIGAFNAHIAPSDSVDVILAGRGDPTGLREVVAERLESAELIFGGKRPEALINLGATYVDLGRPDDAIDAFAAALEVIRGPRVQGMLQTSDSTLALAWLDREMVVTFNRAQLLTQAEHYEEAAAEYEAYLESYPDDIMALSSRAAALTAAGMIDDAEAIYDELLAGEGLGIRDYFNIGVGLYQADDFVNAAAAFGNVVEVSPQNREALYNQANSLILAEEYEACVPVAMKLLDLDGFNRENHTTLGLCLARSGKDQEAVEYLCRGNDPHVQVLAGCEIFESLDFSVSNGRLEVSSGGGGTVTGEFTNTSLDSGTQVTIRVHFNGEDGATVGTTSLRVEALAQGETTTFQADLVSDEEVMGYYFQVIPPR